MRKSFSNDELLLNLVTSSTDSEKFDKHAFAAFLKELLGKRMAGFIHTINDDVADRAKLEQGPSGLVTGNENHY